MDLATREILEDIIGKAKNYNEFVHLLSEKACSEQTTDLTAFFAIHHASNIFDTDCLEELADRFGRIPIAKPNLYMISALQGKHEDLQKAIDATETVIQLNPSGWLELEMLVIRLEAEMLGYPKFTSYDSTMDRIESFLDAEEDYDFYRSRIYDALALKTYRDGDIEETRNLTRNAISNAEKHNELYKLSRLYRSLAVYTQAENMIHSKEFLEKSLKLLEFMGDKEGLGYTLYQIGKIQAIRGEYDQAIENTLNVTRIFQNIGKTTEVFTITLSTLYNMIGEAQAGLEWAKMAEAESKHVHKPRAVLNQVWALAVMGKLDDALEVLDDVRETILKSGMESHLAGLYLIEGIVENACGNLLEAQSSIQDALEIYEKRGALMTMHISLVHLARIEIESVASGKSSDIGPWLELLEERARLENYPGLLGIALSLKALYNIHYGKSRIARDSIRELEDIVYNWKLHFLERSVKNLQERIS